MKFAVQRQILTKNWDLIKWLWKTFLTLQHPITKDLFISRTFYQVHHALQSRKNNREYQKAKTKTKNKLKTQRKSENYKRGTLELSDQKFKTTMINILKALVDKMKNMQQQVVGFCRQMEIQRNNWEEMLEIKNTET